MCKKCLEILISKSNDKKNWETAQLEWTGEASINSHDRCICGIESGECFSLTNTLNGENCIIGRICILNPKLSIFKHNNELIDLASNKYCKTCDKTLNYASFNSHLKSAKHLKIINDIKIEEQLNIARKKEYEERQQKIKKENEELEIKKAQKRQEEKEAQEQIQMNNRKCQKCELFKIPKIKPIKNIFCMDCFMSFIAKNSNCPDCDCKITDKQFNTYKRCYDCCLKKKGTKNNGQWDKGHYNYGTGYHFC